MRVLRLAFGWCFAIAAVALLWMAWAFLHVPVTSDGGSEASVVIGRAVMVGVPLAFGVLFGVSWWTILKRKTSARQWAISASLVPVVFSLLMVSYVHPFNILWVPLAIGSVGLVVFARRDVIAATVRKPPVYSPIPGDGTSTFVNGLMPVAGAIGAIDGTAFWSTWAASHGLPGGHPHWLYLQYLIAVLLVLFLHEGGHAIAGIALKMKLVSFVVGPFEWRIVDGQWRFRFRPAGLLFFLGHTAVVPAEMENFRRRKVLQVAAGPAASVVTGLMAALAVSMAPGRPWANDWRVLTYFATLSFFVGIVNLVPFSFKSGYSDGAKLYQLRSEGLWADYHRLLAVIASTTVTSRRPRDYDIETVERAAGSIAKGINEVQLHLCAYAFYLDTGQLDQASQAMAKAESLCQESSLKPQDDWYSIFVFAHAFLRHDAAAARRWWERMEARKSYRFGDGLWESRCALLWSENRLEEASEAWKKADAWARQLPAAGAWDAQRHAIQLMGQALNQSLLHSPT